MSTDTIERPETDGKITCHLDGARVHSIQKHLRDNYPEMTVEEYKKKYPSAPLLSEKAQQMLRQRLQKQAPAGASNGKGNGTDAVDMRPLADVFGFPADKCKNSRGDQIMVPVCTDLDDDAAALVPDIDHAYVFNIELTKTALIGIMLNMPTYFWGFHGTGKTTSFEQICARLNRPFSRIQHTINTEESHIVGQYVVRDGATEYQLGPLPVAMINGYSYCADEYDFAMPSVLSVYQPVLEGKPLVIKDAPPHLRVIRPHPNFRFTATGNTNGGGDETGLYQGTQMQNVANYSRFRIVEEVQYMEPRIEAAVIAAQARVSMKEAEKLVEFATEVRTMFKGGRIGSVISPRELIGAAEIGLIRGGDWRTGLRQGFSNRLSRTDKETVEAYAQRLFGGE